MSLASKLFIPIALSAASFSLVYLAIEKTPVLKERAKALQPQQAMLMKQQMDELSKNLRVVEDGENLNKTERYRLVVKREQINALNSTLGHLLDKTVFGVGYTPVSAQLALSREIHLLEQTRYINVYCEIALSDLSTSSMTNTGFRASDNNKPKPISKIDFCRIGRVEIPGWAVSGILYGLNALLVDLKFAEAIDQSIQDVYVEDQALVLFLDKNLQFFEKNLIKTEKADSFAYSMFKSRAPDTELIQLYLDSLPNSPQSRELHVYVRRLMQLAAIRSVDGDPIEENRAALWALASSLGSSQFAKILGVTKFQRNYQTRLRNRRDLSLHFLFSAIIADLSNSRFSLNIGELKEIMDTAKGGSGFSFADLLADNTGVAFAKVLTYDTGSAIRAQNLFMQMRSEDDLIPSIDKLPEGYSEVNFAKDFQNTQSKEYKAFVEAINARILSLEVYSSLNSIE